MFRRFFISLFPILLAMSLMTGCAQSNSFSESATTPTETASVVMEITTEPSIPVIVSKIRFDRDTYKVSTLVYPAELGAPILSDDAIDTLLETGDTHAASMSITNIGDAMNYLVRSGNLDNAQNACNLFASLIQDDYAQVGVIHLSSPSDHFLVYILHDGQYYPIDPIHNEHAWLIKKTYNCTSDPDLQALCQRLCDTYPYHGGGVRMEKWDILEIGEVLKHHGAETFSYIGTTFPSGLGKPLLSDEEIDALIAEQDYTKAAETIATLPDAVNYYFRSGFTFYDKKNNNRIGEFNYYQSAWQVLKSNSGQCVTMSNLNHYFLKDDYDEIGYVQVRSPGDGHVMTYILEDGIYYLVNSVDYTSSRSMSWLDSYPNILGYSEDFQTIADSLVSYMTLGDGKKVNLVHLILSPGDYVTGMQGNKRLYPEGYEVTEYYGPGYTFAKARQDWQSQTRIDE